MQTQTINSEEQNKQPSLLNVIVMAVVGSAILFSGFIMSLFLLALSAIILPFAAFKLWLLQKQFKQHIKSTQDSFNNQDTDKGTVIEGEYVVTKNTKYDQ